MGIYYIKNYNGKYLNISGEDLKDLSSHLNVTLWSKDNNSNEQKWVFDSPSSFVKIKSLVNLAYALSHCEESGADYGTPGNCDVDYHYANESYTHINFVPVGNYYLIKQTHSDLYLTANGNTNGSNVTWEYRATTTTGNNDQKWKCEEYSTTGVFASVSANSSNLTVGQKEYNANYIYDYLSNDGFEKRAICAVLGNFEQESQLDPGVWDEANNLYMGYGLAQWDDAINFINYAKSIGVIQQNTAESINNLASTSPKVLMDTELQYLIHTCESDNPIYFCKPVGSIVDHTGEDITYEEFKTSNLPIDTLTKIFHDYYEKSNDPDEIIQKRVQNAINWYLKLG